MKNEKYRDFSHTVFSIYGFPVELCSVMVACSHLHKISWSHCSIDCYQWWKANRESCCYWTGTEGPGFHCRSQSEEKAGWDRRALLGSHNWAQFETLKVNRAKAGRQRVDDCLYSKQYTCFDRLKCLKPFSLLCLQRKQSNYEEINEKK